MHRNVSRPKIAILISLVLMLLCVALCAIFGRALLFGASGSSTLPASTIAPPNYPGAMNETSRKEQTEGYATARIVTFQTADKPETVFDFYRKALAQDGWEPRQILPSRRSYHYIQAGGGAGLGSDPEFSLEIVADQSDAIITDITLNLISYPSR